MSVSSKELKDRILGLVSEYHEIEFAEKPFIAGQSKVPVSGRVFDQSEIQELVNASLEFWLTTGRFAKEFELSFAKFFGLRHASLVNSGSSANLVAISSLSSPLLTDRSLKPGDEVITVAAGFPTTVNPIIQNNFIPVFVDVEIPTYNINVNKLVEAFSEKTRAVVIAHTLGNPFNLKEVVEFTKKHNLFLIEDCCDALGSTYNGNHVGTFGDFATTSFYPAHHITMGEGGCVLTNNPKLKRIAESIRDWGRDCWCDPGVDNTCGKRFCWELGTLPYGYDHKYTYSHLGYNLKATDLQAAVGVAQLKKLEKFIQLRKNNFQDLYAGLLDLEDFLILPEATENSSPSWFGFPISVKSEAPFSRTDLVQALEKKGIGTRLVFAGNLIRQPAYKNCNYRISGSLENSDFVMNNSFWVGVYPGITAQMLNYMIEMFHTTIKELESTNGK